MSRLPVISSRKLISALKKAGFHYAPRRGKGSHIALYKIDDKGKYLLVIIPTRKAIPKGTLSAILQQARITANELTSLLSKKRQEGGGRDAF